MERKTYTTKRRGISTFHLEITMRNSHRHRLAVKTLISPGNIQCLRVVVENDVGRSDEWQAEHIVAIVGMHEDGTGRRQPNVPGHCHRHAIEHDHKVGRSGGRELLRLAVDLLKKRIVGDLDVRVARVDEEGRTVEIHSHVPNGHAIHEVLTLTDMPRCNFEARFLRACKAIRERVENHEARLANTEVEENGSRAQLRHEVRLVANADVRPDPVCGRSSAHESAKGQVLDRDPVYRDICLRKCVESRMVAATEACPAHWVSIKKPRISQAWLVSDPVACARRVVIGMRLPTCVG